MTTHTLAPYMQLGSSGLVVYRVGLGTMQFGWSVDEPGAFDVASGSTGASVRTSPGSR